jgi:hypothetical protein
MDLKELNASQLVLLTLLVSFVTSIATGIVTVSLMEQAPPIVAQTVNRVVERTVERVVPAAQEASAVNATPIVTEKTVVVKETDYIAAAIEKISPSVVRLFAITKDADGEDADIFLGLGVIASAEGMIYADNAAWPASSEVLIERSDGSRVSSVLVARDERTGVLTLAGATSTDDGPLNWRAAEFARATALGSPVVSVAGRSTMRVGHGIVSAMLDSGGESLIGFIDTSVPTGAIVYGSVVVDERGHVLGVSTGVSRATAETAFLASAHLPMYTQDEPKAASE